MENILEADVIIEEPCMVKTNGNAGNIEALPLNRSPYEHEIAIGASEANAILVPALAKLSLTNHGLNYELQEILSAKRKYKDFYEIHANVINQMMNVADKCVVSVLHRPWDANDCIAEATFEIAGKEKIIKVTI